MPDRFDLDGKVAIITGASSGIGAAIGVELAGAGASVALVGRNRGRLTAAVESVEGAGGGRAAAVETDLTSDGGPAQIVGETLEVFGRIDVVVHAAGLFKPEPFADTTDDLLDEQWKTNVRAPYRLTQAVLPHLEEGSAIIFISSIAGHVGFLNSSAYCATKGAVELLVKALANELAPRGIRVNAIAPGNVRTPMNEHLLADPDYEQTMVDATPAGRIGEVEDIAPAVLFLASGAAKYVHGASIVVDGGWVAA
jgi:NAD(P)-dependent dehydrogenase (short-subunit alcohol dehydrogenase family)